MVFGDQWLQDVLAPLLQCSEGRRLVLLNEADVANHVCGKDSGKATIDLRSSAMARSSSGEQSIKLYERPLRVHWAPGR